MLPIISQNIAGLRALVISVIALGPALGLMGTIGLIGAGLLMGLATSIGYMASSLTELSMEDSLVKFINVVETIDDSSADRLKDVMDEAERYVEIQAGVNAASATSPIADSVEKLLDLVTGNNDKSSGQNKREVILQLDEREFARAVVNVLDGKMKLNTL